MTRIPIHQLMDMLTNLQDLETCEEVGIELEARLSEGRLRYEVYKHCKDLVYNRMGELEDEEG